MERKSLEEAFAKIYDIGGIEVLQSAEFQEYFADIAPELQKYRGIVKSFVNIEGNKNLVKIISSNTEKQKIEVLKIVQELEDKYLYKKENCTDICIAFCRTIGINIDICEKEKSIEEHINTTKEKNDIKISTTTQKNIQNNSEIEKYIAFCRTIGININSYKSIEEYINTTKEKSDIKISTTTQKNIQNNSEIEKYRVGDIIS